MVTTPLPLILNILEEPGASILKSELLATVPDICNQALGLFVFKPKNMIWDKKIKKREQYRKNQL